MTTDFDSLSVRIPTVLQVAADEPAEPYIAIIDAGGGAYLLSLDEAVLLAGWMRIAHKLYTHPGAERLAETIDRALGAIVASPARVIERPMLGLVQGEAHHGTPLWLRVALEGGVNEPSNPRVALDFGESPHALDRSVWLLDQEANELSRLLGLGASTSDEREVGRLEEVGPNRRPWLFVSTAPPPQGAGRGLGVVLRFDEESDDRPALPPLWLEPLDATRLGSLLGEAVRLAASRPPHVYVRPEPNDRVIATIRTTGEAAG
jgi:hypothetical protein